MPIYEAEDLDPLPQETLDTKEWRAYHAGMRSLGRGLVVLGILQLLIAGALLVLWGNLIGFVVIAALAAVHLIMGVLVLLRQHWVNYVVAVWGVLLIVANLVVLPTLRGAGGAQNQSPGTCVGIVIAITIVHSAVKNVKLHKRATASYSCGE